MNFLTVIKNTLAKGGRLLKKHAPTILTGCGAGGAVTAVIFAVKATPKALIMIDEKKRKKEKEKLTPMETVEACWKAYIPTAGVLTASIGCIIGANCLNLSRMTTLAGLYSAADMAAKEYQSKVVEAIGKEKEHEIRHALNQEKVDTRQDLAAFTPIANDEFPCLDKMTGQIFSSNKMKLENYELKMRDKLRGECYVSKNEWLRMIGCRDTNDGNGYGWDDASGFEIYVDTCEVNGIPCFVVDYEVDPKARFNMYS